MMSADTVGARREHRSLLLDRIVIESSSVAAGLLDLHDPRSQIAPNDAVPFEEGRDGFVERVVLNTIGHLLSFILRALGGREASDNSVLESQMSESSLWQTQVIRNGVESGALPSLTPSLIIVVEKVVPLHQSVSSISTYGEASADLTNLPRNRKPYALWDIPMPVETLNRFQILFAEILLKLLQRNNRPIGIVRCCGIIYDQSVSSRVGRPIEFLLPKSLMKADAPAAPNALTTARSMRFVTMLIRDTLCMGGLACTASSR